MKLIRWRENESHPKMTSCQDAESVPLMQRTLSNVGRTCKIIATLTFFVSIVGGKKLVFGVNAN